MGKENIKAVALSRLSLDGEFIEAGEKVTLFPSVFKNLFEAGWVEFDGDPVDLGDANGSSDSTDDSDNGANPRIFGSIE